MIAHRATVHVSMPLRMARVLAEMVEELSDDAACRTQLAFAGFDDVEINAHLGGARRLARLIWANEIDRLYPRQWKNPMDDVNLKAEAKQRVERFTPASREEWLKLRRHDVTASQIGALLGVHPYCTTYQLWAEKTGKQKPDDDLGENAAMRRGRLLEGIAAGLTAEKLTDALSVRHNSGNQYWRMMPARIGGTPDMLVEDGERGLGVVQLKSVEPSLYARNWPDGEPPLWIALQALCEAMLTDAKWAAVGVLRVGHAVDFDLVDVPIHPGAWQRLADAVGAFWVNVARDTPPLPDYARDAKLIASLYPVSTGHSIDLSQDNEFVNAVAEREHAKQLLKVIEADVDRTEALIRHKMAEHEAATAGDYRITLRSESVKEYVVKARTRRPIRVKRIKETA